MSHAPKQRALEAYASELLSARAVAQLERHLRRCTACTETLAAVRAYALLREEAEAAAVPALNWDRLSAALDVPPAAPARVRTGKAIAFAWPLLAVAATLLIVWIGMSGAPSSAPTPRAQRSLPARTMSDSAAFSGQVSLLAGAVQLEVQGTQSTLSLTSEIREGSLLTTGPDAALHVQLGAGTGFALGPDSQLRVSRLRQAEVKLELLQGSVSSQVAKRAAEQRYAVVAGDLTAQVRGTRFQVERQTRVEISVQEGQVEVVRGAEVLALLGAGQSYQVPPQPASPPLREMPVHLLAGPLQNAGVLQLPKMAELRAWIIDGAPVSAQGTLALRLPKGPTQLKFADLRGQIRSVEVDLSAALTSLEPGALAKLVAPKDARVGSLAPEQISGVVRAGLEPLRRCYERSLRVFPALAGKLTLAMRVAADGHVIRADVTGTDKLPLELERCIEQEASRFSFPKPEGAGPVSFEVPLNLKSRN